MHHDNNSRYPGSGGTTEHEGRGKTREMINYDPTPVRAHRSASIISRNKSSRLVLATPGERREGKGGCSRGELNPSGCAATVFQSPCGGGAASPCNIVKNSRPENSRHFAESFQVEARKSRELKKEKKKKKQREDETEIKRCQDVST